MCLRMRRSFLRGIILFIVVMTLRLLFQGHPPATPANDDPVKFQDENSNQKQQPANQEDNDLNAPLVQYPRLPRLKTVKLPNPPPAVEKPSVKPPVAVPPPPPPPPPPRSPPPSHPREEPQIPIVPSDPNSQDQNGPVDSGISKQTREDGVTVSHIPAHNQPKNKDGTQFSDLEDRNNLVMKSRPIMPGPYQQSEDPFDEDAPIPEHVRVDGKFRWNTTYDRVINYANQLDSNPWKQTWSETETLSLSGCNGTTRPICNIVKPSFLVIGGQKCGTTSLHEYMVIHPQIVDLSQESKVLGHKEIRFFDRTGFDSVEALESAIESMYLKNFARISELRSLHKKPDTRIITGESTPNYIRFPKFPERVKKTFPNMKIIALLRDPVDRAYSHYHHGLRSEKNKIYSGGNTFEALFRAEIKVLESCYPRMANWSLFYNCVNSQRLSKAAEGVGVPKMRHGALQWLLQMVQRGLYSLQLRHFFDYLDPSQILLVRSEDLYEDPVKVMKRIEKFLGLTSYDWEPFFEHKKVFNFGKANRVTSSESGIEYEPMKEEIRRELEKFFEPFNQDLYRMFKDTDPFPGWKYPKPVKKPKTEEADLASEDPPEYPADS